MLILVNNNTQVKIEFVNIPAGSFVRDKDEVLLNEFKISKYLITQEVWEAVAQLPGICKPLKVNPSHFKGSKRPVEDISWCEAIEFCARLSNFTGSTYRLPTEAEWEYACRAGTTTPFYFGNNITTDLVNYDGDYIYNDSPRGISRNQTTNVGIFPPNDFGLYDMHGNVCEWCLDQIGRAHV